MKDDRGPLPRRNEAGERTCLKDCAESADTTAACDNGKRTEASFSPPRVETGEVGKHIVYPFHSQLRYIRMEDCAPVRVRRVLFCIPDARIWEFVIDPPLRLGLVVYTVKSNNPLQEDV